MRYPPSSTHHAASAALRSGEEAGAVGESGGAAEAVIDGETGIVVEDPRSVAALADALRTLLADADLRRRMGEAGRQRAVESFSYDVLAAELRSALDGPGFR